MPCSFVLMQSGPSSVPPIFFFYFFVFFFPFTPLELVSFFGSLLDYSFSSPPFFVHLVIVPAPPHTNNRVFKGRESIVLSSLEGLLLILFFFVNVV